MLDDNRLAEIRERAVRAACGKRKDDGWLFCRIDAPALLAEVERLQELANRDRTMHCENCERTERENIRLRAELEAAKRDLRNLSDEYKFCDTCKYCGGDGVDGCTHPRRFSCDRENFYEWRGAPSPGEGERGGGTDGKVD